MLWRTPLNNALYAMIGSPATAAAPTRQHTPPAQGWPALNFQAQIHSHTEILTCLPLHFGPLDRGIRAAAHSAASLPSALHFVTRQRAGVPVATMRLASVFVALAGACAVASASALSGASLRGGRLASIVSARRRPRWALQQVHFTKAHPLRTRTPAV